MDEYGIRAVEKTFTTVRSMVSADLASTGGGVASTAKAGRARAGARNASRARKREGQRMSH